MKKFLFSFIYFFSFSFLLLCENNFYLNFNNVDIRTFIKFVSEITKENYVIDPNVRGTITIYSTTPIPVEQIDRVFKAVLNFYGFTTIKKDNISLIVPISDGKTRTRYINISDIPKDKEEEYIIQVISLKYYPPDTISQIITPYITKGGQITVDTRTNTLIISDVGENIKKIMEIIEKIDKPSPPGQEEIRIFKLQNADAEEVAKVLGQILQRKISAVRPSARTAPIQPQVVSAKATNSLIIYADPNDFDTIEKIIKELDILTNQVLIEALIAEVTFDKTQQLGIEWANSWKFNNEQYTGAVGTDFGDIASYIKSGVPPSGLSLAFYKGDFTYPLSVGALINLYAKDSQFNILSTPQIVTADNQEAKINISENIPYLKETRFYTYGSGQGSDVVKSYDYKDVGIVLKITPQISQDKYVKLKISQEVTKLVEGGIPEAPTTAKRQAETTLIIPNGKTVVLGGLLRNDSEKSVQKVPFLGDIPLLGRLFRKDSTKSIKTNLMIFITPHIISTFEDAEKIKQEKEKLIKEKNNG
ncbi:MAG TPA: secretin N-terminal domain-containing protein [bacterium]|nr:secretin N-terminal domain-containing protein [bacterium]